MRTILSRSTDALEEALGRTQSDRAAWVVVAFAAGIGAWFALPLRPQWVGLAAASAFLSVAAAYAWHGDGGRAHLRLAITAMTLAFAAGIVTVWVRSTVVGAEPLPRPLFTTLDARILDRIEQPAENRVRLVVAARATATGQLMKLRLNVALASDQAALIEGARIRTAARLMPPSPPLLPGAYDFARTAWFEGYAATGSVIGEIQIVERPLREVGLLARAQRGLAEHTRSQIAGSPGAIAAALTSGDRGAISAADEAAMRDAGLTHLLSISGLHVSALIGAAYVMTMRLLALWGWLTLRVRLPLLAATVSAAAGVGYTLLTGAEVPTVRSCVGALLVLSALALGREPLSIRMVAVAAGIVLVLWPETLVGPSFQMSFAAVVAIIAFHGSAPVRAFLAPREEASWRRTGRRLTVLFATGVVIELALTPIILFHFHRSGFYGALANVVAIPLTTFVSMPALALALFMDLLGLGTQAWWIAARSLELLLWIAHSTAALPGSVRLYPHMSTATIAAFVTGLVWLGFWTGRARLAGLIPIMLGVIMLARTPVPDILVTRDGREVGVTAPNRHLYLLRSTDRSTFARDSLVELSGSTAPTRQLADWPGARCSLEFCSISIRRDGRRWHILVARNRNRIDGLALQAACERSDVVIADRYLPRRCRPRILKLDREWLDVWGGTSLYLGQYVRTVSNNRNDHPWIAVPASLTLRQTDRQAARGNTVRQ